MLDENCELVLVEVVNVSDYIKENRSFVRSEKNLYSNEEKLAELVERLKRDYDNGKKLNAGKTRYDSKRKKHVPVIPQGGFVAKAVRIFYTDLSD